MLLRTRQEWCIIRDVWFETADVNFNMIQTPLSPPYCLSVVRRALGLACRRHRCSHRSYETVRVKKQLAEPQTAVWFEGKGEAVANRLSPILVGIFRTACRKGREGRQKSEDLPCLSCLFALAAEGMEPSIRGLGLVCMLLRLREFPGGDAGTGAPSRFRAWSPCTVVGLCAAETLTLEKNTSR